MNDQSKFTISNFAKKKWNDYASDDCVSDDCRYSGLTSMYGLLFDLVSKIDEQSSQSKRLSRKKPEQDPAIMETRFPEGFVSMMRYMSESNQKELTPRPLRVISKKDLLAARAKCLVQNDSQIQLQIVKLDNRTRISYKQNHDSEPQINALQKKKYDSDKHVPSHLSKTLITPSYEKSEALQLSEKYTNTVGSLLSFNNSNKNTLKLTVETDTTWKRVDKGQDKMTWFSTDIKEKPLKKSVLRYRLRQIAIEKSSAWYREYISIVEPSARGPEDPTTPRHNISSTCGQFYDSLHSWRHSIRRRVEKLKFEKNEDTN